MLGFSSISVTGYIGYNLLQRFDHTKTWKRVSKTTLAELTPELSKKLRFGTLIQIVLKTQPH